MTGAFQLVRSLLSPDAARSFTNIAWNLLATLANQGSSFVTIVALARILDAKAFGAYVAVLSTGQIATLVAGAGMGYTATKYVAEFAVANPAKASRIFGFCLGFSALGALTLGSAIALAAPFMAQAFFSSPELTEPLRFAGGICLFMTVNAILTGALAGLGKFRALSVVGVFSGLLYVGITAGGALLWGVKGAAFGLLVSGALQTVGLSALVLRAAQRMGVRPDFRHAMSERRVLLSFALPAAIAGVTTAASLWLGQMILARHAGLVEIGLYSVASNLLTITMLTPSVANTVGMSMLNSARGAGDTLRFNRLFKANLAITFVLVMLGAMLVGGFGTRILAVFGPGFLAAYPALLVLLLAAVPESMGLAFYQMLQSRERMWLAMRMVMLPRDLALPLLALVWVPDHGAMGLALAFLASRSIYLVTTIIATRRTSRWV